MPIDAVWRYIMEQFQVMSLIDKNEIENLANIVMHQIDNDRQVIFVGTGGCASLANKYKGKYSLLGNKSGKCLNVRSLSGINAIQQLTSFEFASQYVFANMLDSVAYKNDLLVVLNSELEQTSISRTLEKANDMRLLTFGITSFPQSNTIPAICDKSIIIKSIELGITEATISIILNAVYFRVLIGTDSIEKRDISKYFMHDGMIGE